MGIEERSECEKKGGGDGDKGGRKVDSGIAVVSSISATCSVVSI